MKWYLLITSAVSAIAYWFSIMGFCRLSLLFSFDNHPLYAVVLFSLLVLCLPVGYLIFSASKIKPDKSDSKE